MIDPIRAFDHYVLNEDHTVSVFPIESKEDFLEWARRWETADRTVRRTVMKYHHVSTVFLGFDHSFGGRRPLLFETMVFTNESYPSELLGGAELHESLGQERYSTWDEAEAGREAIVQKFLELERESESVVDDLMAKMK